MRVLSESTAARRRHNPPQNKEEGSLVRSGCNVGISFGAQFIVSFFFFFSFSFKSVDERTRIGRKDKIDARDDIFEVGQSLKEYFHPP